MQRDALTRNEITRYAITMLNLKPKFSINSSTREMAFHCPFHVDKTPSLFINFDMGVYNCFSCGKSGSIESLYYEITGQSLKKALGITSDRFTNFAQASNASNLSYNYDLSSNNHNLKNIYINMDETKLVPAWSSRVCRSYLIKRGITKEVSFSMNFKYAQEILINNTRFYRRLIIPIYENGHMIAVEGRRIFKDDPDPKVLYAKNCSVNSLFDIDNLDKNSTVYAVEGLMDLAVLRTCPFFKNSTAIFGANLTERQLFLISNFKKFVYINDNDEAGLNTIKKLKNSNLKNVYQLNPPKEILGVTIKDIGDLPSINITPYDLLNKKWLSYIKKI